MRRTLTPCAVTSSGNHLPLNRVELTDRRLAESFLQVALHRHPALLPVGEIDTAFAPLVSLGREIANIDNLFISPAGRLVVVETKLWRNPESGREVVGQLLDYAAVLGRWSYEDVERAARDSLDSPLVSSESLYAHVARHFPDDVLPESDFIDAVQKTLRTGRFLLLIVGDGIREGVERMLDHLHDHPQRLFTFGLVEIGIYENPEVFSGRILLPSLVAKSTEIVRAVVRVETAGPANVSVVTAPHEAEEAAGYQRRTLSEEEFFQELPNERTRALYGRLFRLADGLGASKTWRSSSVSLRLPDPNGSSRDITLLVLNTRGQVFPGWMPGGLRRLGLPESIATDYVNSLCRIFPNVQPHARNRGTLSRELTVEEVESRFDELADAVRDVIDALTAASGQSQERFQ